jgi:hypothetical protein
MDKPGIKHCLEKLLCLMTALLMIYHELGLPATGAAVLLYLLQAEVVELLLDAKLLELPLQVDDRLLDPLLALVPRLLAVLVFQLFTGPVPTRSLLLLLYPVNFVLQVE